MFGFNQQAQGMQDMMRQLQSDPRSFFQQKGLSVPDEMLGNPQAMVMHLIQSGQVSSPMLQRIMPMIQKMGK